MPAPVFIQPRATQSLSGLGALDDLEPAGVRAMSAGGLLVSGLIGYGAYHLYKTKHPVWATLVGLVAITGVPGALYGVATGKLPGSV